jgi:hypothetical protein
LTITLVSPSAANWSLTAALWFFSFSAYNNPTGNTPETQEKEK